MVQSASHDPAEPPAPPRDAGPHRPSAPAREPTNGYSLTLRIQATTNDVLNVDAGSLYPARYRLEQRGLLRATWAESATGRQTTVYSLILAGRKHLTEQCETWERFGDALAANLRTA